jgi:hypothetical protein
MWLAAPNVIVAKYSGHSDASFVDFVTNAFDRLVSARPEAIHLFIDCEEQTGYDGAFADGIAEWSKAAQPRLRTTCVLVRSRIVAFGVAVVNVLSGGRATMVTSRDAFFARLSGVIGGVQNDDVA